VARTNPVVSTLFLVAALYDAILGVIFLFAAGAVFDWLGVTPPNHLGYVQFPAALLIIFALIFYAIAMDPIRNRGLILYGILLKLSYCGVVLFHWLTAGVPYMWKPFCVLDLLFMILFAWAWVQLGRPRPENHMPTHNDRERQR